MAATPPVSFDALAKTAANPAIGGYPYALAGVDLDKNFTFATCDYSDKHFKVTKSLGSGGHANREVALANPLPSSPTTGTYVLGVVEGELKWVALVPTTGTHVLGAEDGELTWLATEEC